MQGGGNFLGLGERQGAVAQPHHHALDARIARRHGRARRPDSSPSAARRSAKARRSPNPPPAGADPRSAPCLPGSPSPRASPITSSAAKTSTSRKTNLAMPFNTAAMIERSQIKKPVMDEILAQRPFLISRPGAARQRIGRENPAPSSRALRKCLRFSGVLASRSASLAPPTAFCTLPLALSAAPSAFSLASPVILPAASLIGALGLVGGACRSCPCPYCNLRFAEGDGDNERP